MLQSLEKTFIACISLATVCLCMHLLIEVLRFASLLARRRCHIPAGCGTHMHTHTATNLPTIKHSHLTAAIFTHVCNGFGIIRSHDRPLISQTHFWHENAEVLMLKSVCVCV